MKQDWNGAVDAMKILKNECQVSPALLTYLYAVCLFMSIEDQHIDMNEEDKRCVMNEISECFRNVPKLKRTLGGKYVFHEKLVIANSLR